jgi:hypothetical protein|tara:strand:+ start:386 stop:496 length:111 start_codon:yes stop_codon:yes gene_type:complete
MILHKKKKIAQKKDNKDKENKENKKIGKRKTNNSQQ